MDYKKIGDLVLELRKEKGMTQKELADKLLITDRAVSKWERGLGCPDISLLDDLSRILDISVIELLKGTRLSEKDKLDNKDLIESMTFAQETLKQRTKQILKGILLFIFFVFTIIITYINIYVIVKENMSYKIEAVDGEMFDEYEIKKNCILTDSGVYTKEEYEIILEYIEFTETKINENKISDYKSDNYYKLKDIRYNVENPFLISALLNDLKYEVIEILLLKDIKLTKEIMEMTNYPINLTYDLFQMNYLNFPLPKENEFKTYQEYVTVIYSREINFLNYIIEVGEIDE